MHPKRLNRKNITVSLAVAMTLSIVLAVLHYIYIERLGNVQFEVQQQLLRKTEIVQSLNVHWGYGGFIHHFKNYVLRRDPFYLSEAELSMDHTRAAIEEFKQLRLNEQEIRALKNFSKVLAAYQRHLLALKDNPQSDTQIATLDLQVTVDDTLAVLALQTLQSALERDETRSFKRQSELLNTIQMISYAAYAAVILIFAVLSAMLFRVYRQGEVQMAKLQTLFDASPDAIFQIDQHGRIVQANRKAGEIFSYSLAELQGLKVEALIPEKLREAHQKQRELFIKSDRQVAMRDRKLQLCGQRKNGEVFPVDISIHTFENNMQKNVVLILRDINERKTMEREQSNDFLTKLPTRNVLRQYIAQLVDQFNRTEASCCFMLCDLDNFGEINKEYGYQMGDQILIEVSQLLKRTIRKVDILGRWDGEEFLILCPYTGINGAESLAELIRARVEQLHPLQDISLTMSIAVMELHDSVSDKDLIVESLTRTLAEHCEQGSNQVVTAHLPASIPNR